MTFREGTREADAGATAAAPGAVTSPEEPETPVALGEEPEDTPRPEPLEAGAAPRGEDPVRLYLKEIGKVQLLAGAQEVQIGRRIEVGQIALRRTLAGIPMAVETLLEVSERLRRGETPPDDVIVLAEGGELDAKQLRPVLLAFGRLRRLQRKIAGLQDSFGDKRRSKASRTIRAKAIAAAHEAIQKVVADLPLKPALVDDVVAQVRGRWERISQLAEEARRNQPTAGRELRELERAVGLVNEMGREPTPEELAQRTGVPAKKVRLILESSRKPLSLETPIGEDSELGDFLEDKSAGSPNESLLNQDLTTQVERALSTLSPKEKEILRLRFGIGEEGEHTLEEVGRRFAVTRERIRQIEAKALRKLRHPLRGRNLRAFVEN